jgi:hypothetical protein
MHRFDLATDTCMVSTFSAFWSGGIGAGRQRRMHASNGMIRFLQTPDETREYDKMTDLLVVYASAQDPSYFPTDNELLYIVSTLLVTPAKDQCISKGVDMG